MFHRYDSMLDVGPLLAPFVIHEQHTLDRNLKGAELETFASQVRTRPHKHTLPRSMHSQHELVRGNSAPKVRVIVAFEMLGGVYTSVYTRAPRIVSNRCRGRDRGKLQQMVDYINQQLDRISTPIRLAMSILMLPASPTLTGPGPDPGQSYTNRSWSWSWPWSWSWSVLH